ncbi:hypothetical protein ATO6_12650 [Oceanicola sp. 22II-s10i]|uniref:TAXI family TRAP transporter solute-binding subunit n=1 Tax=Oceanicola sp. 22II-s10i TaxID=1317116 RepID=UPI000B6AFE6C|nr:TAXI family TRAP transporter solute-binding subunit [Oceanicola sp. 22II-s10i]OWU84522.1 hypothetical protein ATO6_12650 [Oceanicola sp. 22II-s10i]
MFGISTARITAAAIALGGMIGAATAQDLPRSMTWMAYQTTSSGYAHTVAIANMLKEQYGTNVRILPGKNDVSRMTPLRDRRAEFCNCGATVWMGQEGVYLFGTKGWGPQPLRIMMSSSADSALMMAVTEASGIETMEDLRGKRVAVIKGSASVNWSLSALLAFADITLDDVEVVEVSGTGADHEALAEGRADATFSSTVSPLTQKVAASPQGLKWLPMPFENEEGWARVQALAPYFVQTNATVGTELSKENPIEGSTYPYPILTTNADQDADVVYEVTKAMVENFDQYKDGAAGATGWALDRQKMQWAIPYHEGSVRYFKEIGKWTEEDQAHNDALIARQAVLMAAWDEFNAGPGADLDGEEFTAAWMDARAEKLRAEGQAVNFD